MSFEMFKSGKLHFSKLEVDVLKCLVEKKRRPNSTDLTELGEIISSTNLRDQDEILRALYTLEGKGLVIPDPVGDFTSSKWKATDNGAGTMLVIEQSLNLSKKAA
ncbi:MAG TPA: hypothetical protein PKA63_02625 [Oligoflexia bacterium]|nr:hypothetical protein [Oligoflexia bacterium]HMP47547.1 hypothetical protein [Oligoflexia bacterium]